LQGTTVAGTVATVRVAGTLLRGARRLIWNLAPAFVVAVLGTLVLAPLARATFPGANGLLAYEDRNGPAPIVRVVSPDGTGIRSLFPRGDADHDPAWSPDGRKLTFARTIAGNGDVWVYDVARGTRPRKLTFDPADDKEPAWSPDNRHVVFSSTRDGNAELYILDTETLALQRLTFDPAADVQPAWSQTNRIVFVSDRTGKPRPLRNRIRS
jgi:dipeptidyl aminopeptidase/acylaminoacyl peptidase